MVQGKRLFGVLAAQLLSSVVIAMGQEKRKETKMTYNTTTKVKAGNFRKFAELIESQFAHGGDKYALAGFEDREATDVISSVFGGPTEFDWILGTMTKYIFRFKNFQREKDLLKIATYCYILWLKQGNHLKEVHDTDTERGTVKKLEVLK